MLVVAGSVAASGGDIDPRVLAPDASVEGTDFGELTEHWWRWAESLPVAPYQDPDGRLCDLGQAGPVWFLAGTDGSFTARRECTIPADRHLLLPVINMLHSNPPRAPKGYVRRRCSELQAAAAVNNDGLNSAVVLIDGEPVRDVARYRVRSHGCFDMDEDREGANGAGDAGKRPGRLAAADGYWLLIRPLAPGRHTIVVGANYGVDADRSYGNMVQNFEYVLDVGGSVNTASRQRHGRGGERLAARAGPPGHAKAP
ncbi:hypothetical protein [Marilutibacter spongiae]|uniref:Uncharacterized protein n=1 Tax=Marilutibacter spongiae TaxID=2025720 RepID=A0A7W3TJT8_9GAMM|nr:hypothetical protein [Lysobacter spongiae]MBB1059541.1 hypothetical protein [Lysobacter spongiae]